MNKKLLVTLLVGVMALAVVNAGLVSYLSNMVSAEVEVKSPIVQSISDTEEGLDDGETLLLLDDMYTGGENEFTFYVETENIAGESITGNVENIVTNPSGLTCADFESVIVSTDSGTGYGPEYNLIALSFCNDLAWNKIQFSYGPTPIEWDAGQIDINKIVVTFNDVVGTYTFTSQIIPTA